MAIQTEPTRIQIPFADSGTKNTIPATNSTPSASQAASWTDGFPTQCSLPLASGGIPPARADFNGIFNTMSQSIRFGQEGGIWAWDATVDYAANRVALGSDGNLYWSVAQSGPNVGGAQDPTTDTGVYWSTMPMLTPPLADDSNKAASTEWVRDLAAAPIYVDPAGSDTNDGMSASTPVQTFSKALAIGSAIAHSGGSDCFIVAAAGSYTGGISASYMRAHIRCMGNITVNGDISLDNQANIIIETSGAVTVNGNVVLVKQNVISFTNGITSWTQTGGLSISGSSIFFIPDNCTASVTRNGSVPISVSQNSFCRFWKLTVVSTSSSQTIGVSYNSFLYVLSDTSITASSSSNHILNITANSSILFGNTTITCSSAPSNRYVIHLEDSSFGAFSNLTANTENANGILVDASSIFKVFSNLTIDSNGSSILYIASKSFASVGSVITITCSSTPYRVVYVTSNSFLFNANTSSKLDISATNASGVTYFVECNNLSWCALYSLTLNGKATVSIHVFDSSYLSINSGGTVTGTVTGGKRYDVNTLSYLNVMNAGVNRIPGATAGTVDSSKFALYG